MVGPVRDWKRMEDKQGTGDRTVMRRRGDDDKRH